ncbi:MAG: hypothetical protein LBE34_06775 [Flavobacteriaceae bacterium]|jgi:hypothetical protein|nr:hypothetical protein [Flavobacteriaceae bacterium]
MKNLNVQELSIGDQMNIDGGWLKTGIGIGVGLGIYLYDHRDRFMDGVRDALYI